MVAVAADIPTIFDVVIDGIGYMFDKRRDDQAQLGYTPTFVPRTNTSGAYGDNEQDFFLTSTQKNWSGGESQKHWGPDEDRNSRFWRGDGILIEKEGQFSLMPTLRHPATPAAGNAQAAVGHLGLHYLGGTTNLYQVSTSGTVDWGAHGAGTPCRFGMCWDGVYLYIAGTTSIRRWDGTSFTTFATVANAGSLCFLNNQLYSCDDNTLRVYSSSGVPTALYVWKDAGGMPYPNQTAVQEKHPKLHTYGSNLLIYWTRIGVTRPELWMYDGDATFKTAQLPVGLGGDIQESNGVVFLSSAEAVDSTENAWTSPGGVIYAWVNGVIQEVYREDEPGGGVLPPIPFQIPALGILSGSLVFTSYSPSGFRIKRYVLETGAVESIGSIGASVINTANRMQISSAIGSICFSSDVTPGYWYFPNTSDNSVARNGTLRSSFYDFSSSLQKLFRGVTVDFDPASGGQVDILYRIDGDVDDALTTLQLNAQPGVEYFLPDNTKGRQIQVAVTLSASGITAPSPIVRRVYTRAAPFHQSYRKTIYHLDLSGSLGKTPIMHRNGTAEPQTGMDLARILYNAVTLQTSVTISDALGSYTGLLDPEGFQITQFNPDEFFATVSARQV